MGLARARRADASYRRHDQCRHASGRHGDGDHLRASESHDVAARNDLRIVTWTLDTRDWNGVGGALGLEEVDARLRPDSVVLMHDPMPRTAALVAGLLDRIEARGHETGPMI